MLACAGCAPSQSFRPADVLGSARAHELGLAVSNVGARPYVSEPARALAQGWWTERLGERWSVSTLVAFDAEAALGGAAVRYDALRTRWVGLGAEAEVGLFWAALSLPAALRLWDGGRLYATPRLGNWGPALTAFVPLGLAVELPGGWSLRGELQLSWADFTYYDRRLHSGLAAAWRWE